MPTRKKAKGKTKAKRKKPQVTKATTRRKTATARKKPAKKALDPALITQESHADRERRGQTEPASPPAAGSTRRPACPRNPLRRGSVSAS